MDPDIRWMRIALREAEKGLGRCSPNPAVGAVLLRGGKLISTGYHSISVLSNFAEGFERDGNAEFMQFLTICKGSVGELRAQLIYCADIELIEEERYETSDVMAESAARLLCGLARYLKASRKRGRKYERRSSPIPKRRRRRPLNSLARTPAGKTRT